MLVGTGLSPGAPDHVRPPCLTLLHGAEDCERLVRPAGFLVDFDDLVFFREGEVAGDYSYEA